MSALKAVAIVGLFLTGTVSAHATAVNLVANGGFESYDSNSYLPDNWTLTDTSGTSFLDLNQANAHSGLNSLALGYTANTASSPPDLGSASLVSDAFSSSGTVDISFSVRISDDAEDNPAPTTGKLSVYLNGILVDTVNVTSLSTTWDTQELTDLTADSTDNTLSFLISDTEGGVISLDDISVTDSTASVPEPATLALFGVGLLGLGLIRRRRAA